jgi:hypothetical protein
MSSKRSLAAAFLVLAQLAFRLTPCPASLVTTASSLPEALAAAVVSGHAHEHPHPGEHVHHATSPEVVPTAVHETHVDAVVGAPCPCGCGQHSRAPHMRASPSPFVPPCAAGLFALHARGVVPGLAAVLPEAPSVPVFHVPISV